MTEFLQQLSVSDPAALDEETKRLLAAIVAFSAAQRRDQPSDERGAGLRLSRTMRRHRLTTRHVSALLSVALWGPMSVTELAERHRVLVKTASLIAVELEQAGLIARRQDATDRRRTIVTVARGKEQLIAQGLTKRAAPLQRTLRQLTRTQREGLLRGLEVLAREISDE